MLITVDHPTGPSHKHYLYSYLKDQTIWQSLKFWNAACFDAIMIERTRPAPKEATAYVNSQSSDMMLIINLFFSHMTLILVMY